ncbi:MAG: ATP synthase F1 subunit delta [Clostridiales bacterium]|nr:ATP synthase F1 subunit delta [Clostridiales bacterium]
MSSANVYAEALYELARETGSEEALLPQLEGISALLKENPGYAGLISSPELPCEERLGLLDEAFGGRTDETVLNLMKLLTQKGRFKLLPEVIQRFRSMYLADKGMIEARVVSAVRLRAEQLERLRAALESKTGKTLLLSEKVDPSVLGGVRVEAEGVMLDGTVAGDIRRLAQELDALTL